MGRERNIEMRSEEVKEEVWKKENKWEKER